VIDPLEVGGRVHYETNRILKLANDINPRLALQTSKRLNKSFPIRRQFPATKVKFRPKLEQELCRSLNISDLCRVKAQLHVFGREVRWNGSPWIDRGVHAAQEEIGQTGALPRQEVQI